MTVSRPTGDAPEGSALPPAGSVSGLTPVQRPVGDPNGTRALRDALVRAMDAVDLSPFEIEEWRTAAVADRLHRAGYRLVPEDEDTEWRLAFALAGTDGWEIARPEPGCDPSPTAVRFRILARAAIQALREGGQ